MWIQAILSHDDLASLFARLMPATIEVGGPDQYISLTELQDVALVPNEGVRVTCKARVRWPVLGLTLPVNLHTLKVMLRPEIVKLATGEALRFRLEVEEADFAGIPTVIDERITDRINRALVERGIEGMWDFTSMLTRSVDLPASLRPLDALHLAAAWGQVKITEEALVLVLSFQATIERGDRDSALPVTRIVHPPAVFDTKRAPVAARGPAESTPELILVAGLGILCGVTFGVMHARGSERSFLDTLLA